MIAGIACRRWHRACIVHNCWHRPWLAMCVTEIAHYRHRALWLALCGCIVWIHNPDVLNRRRNCSKIKDWVIFIESDWLICRLMLRSDMFHLDMFWGFIIIKVQGECWSDVYKIMRWYLVCRSHLIEKDIKIDEYRWFMMYIARSDVFFGNKNCVSERIFGGVSYKFNLNFAGELYIINISYNFDHYIFACI